MNQNPTSKYDNQEIFSKLAPHYDFLNHLLSLNVDRHWRRKAASLAQPESSSRILDVCTGTGDLAFELERRTTRAKSIQAVDCCPEMIAIALKKQHAASMITFSTADALCLPFQDSSFELVTSGFGLRSLQSIEAGIREMTRVCIPGGRVMILEFSAPTHQPLKSIYGMYLNWFMPAIGSLAGRELRRSYQHLSETVSEFPDAYSIAQLMQLVGLTNVEIKRLSFGLAIVYVATKPFTTSDSSNSVT